MKLEKKDIIGYQLNEEIVCSECINDDELRDINQDDIITEDDVDDGVMFFCDRCKKLMFDN